MTPGFEIRNLQREEVSELICLPRVEGREMGCEAEVLTWLATDPRGIFVAVDSDGRIAGCCCGIILSEYHGYIGMYVVKDTCRGLGLGRQLWNAAIDHLGDRNVSLSSADKMLGFYRNKAGFDVAASWTVDMYTAAKVILPSGNFSSSILTVLVEPNGSLVEDVVDYDSCLHGYDRSRIVRSTVQEPGTLTILAPGRGYACLKKSLQGHWLLAPLYADDSACALALLWGLLSVMSHAQRRDGFVAKLVSSNTRAAHIFAEFGFRRSTYRLHRLFTRELFPIPEENIFALQSSVFCTE